MDADGKSQTKRIVQEKTEATAFSDQHAPITLRKCRCLQRQKELQYGELPPIGLSDSRHHARWGSTDPVGPTPDRAWTSNWASGDRYAGTTKYRLCCRLRPHLG